MTRFATPFFLTALLCLAVPGADAAEKLIADYGGHAGFQSATWVGRDLRIFEKHGLDVEIFLSMTSSVGAAQGVIYKAPDAAGVYCHLKFPTIREDTLFSDRPHRGILQQVSLRLRRQTRDPQSQRSSRQESKHP